MWTTAVDIFFSIYHQQHLVCSSERKLGVKLLWERPMPKRLVGHCWQASPTFFIVSYTLSTLSLFHIKLFHNLKLSLSHFPIFHSVTFNSFTISHYHFHNFQTFTLSHLTLSHIYYQTVTLSLLPWNLHCNELYKTKPISSDTKVEGRTWAQTRSDRRCHPSH